MRKLPGGMRWILALVENWFVALPAIRVREIVISIHMTILTTRCDVRARKRKTRRRVIELRWLPCIG